MEDEFEIAYTAVSHGAPVRSSDGTTVGTVERVLDIPDLDLFDGIVIDTSQGVRFVDRDHVARITNHAVYGTFTTDEAAALPVPDSAPTYRADAGRRGPVTTWVQRLLGRSKWKRDQDDT